MLSERADSEKTREVIDTAFAEVEPMTNTKFACDLLGKSRSTLHRARHPKPKAEGPARPRADHPAKLSPEEAHEVIETLNSRRFMDKSPATTNETEAPAQSDAA